MSRPASNQAPAVTTRKNEYFVPRDGIDREVISADICRYLGNDALVRPGQYENPQTGQVVQGYFITAYRNLTTAMIDDLKADSARWESERRAQTSRNTSGGIHASRDASGVPARHSSNSPVVQYRLSETHQSRQHHGPSDADYGSDPYGRDPAYETPRYPGTGAPGYTGASPQFSQQQPSQPYPPQGAPGYSYPHNQQSPPPGSAGYPPNQQPGSMMGFPSGQDTPYIATGANNNRYDAYAGRAGASAGPPQPTYASAPPPQPGYPAAYPYSGQGPPSAGHSGMPPQDGYYGRASPAGQNPTSQPAGYSSQAPPQQQYDANPLPPASGQPSVKAQAPPSGSSNQRNDRETDRYSDRHHRTGRR